MELVNTKMIKPGQRVNLEDLYSFEGYNGFKVEKGDNGILLILYTEQEDRQVRILGGDGVFAAGDKVIDLVAYDHTGLYLESGPYMHHEGEYKDHIVIYSDYDDIQCAVVQLV